MRVYIASKYLAHETINHKIHTELQNAGIDSFLPKSINIDAITDAELFQVGERCYDEIDGCDVILVVYPRGDSVSSEVGYAICQKRKMKIPKTIISFVDPTQYIFTKREAMITPYYDYTVHSIQELIALLKNLNESTNLIPTVIRN